MAVSASWAEAQRAVIGSLLLAPELSCGEVFQTATPEMFGDAAMRHVFEAAMRIWESSRPLDPVTLLAEAGGDYAKLLQECMEKTPTAVNVKAWVEVLRSAARLSAMQTQALAILNAESEQDAAEAFERAGQLLQGTEDIEDLSATELIGEYIDRMRDGTVPNYLNWGIEKLDQTLAVVPGDFVILAADSSVGKTALALQFAWHLAETGRRVGFFSLETSRQNIADRLMAEHQVAGIPLPNSKGKLLNSVHFEAAGKAGMKSDRIDLRIIRKATTLPAIRARILMRKLDVAFIDYLQLIEVPRSESRWETVTEISMGLHRMAQDLGVTIVGLSQITVDKTQKKRQAPTKDDLRESRQLKQDADVIMLLSASSDEKDPAHARVLEVAKNKEGRTGKLKLRFEPEYMSFTELITMDGLRAEVQAKKNKSAPPRADTPDQVKLEEVEDDGDLPF